MTISNDSLGLYIHIPFCLKKCHYCDFISYPYGDAELLVDDYLKALRHELQLHRELLEQRQKYLDSIFIGGGTPTCLTSQEILKIFETLNQFFKINKDIEFTVEANPGTITKQKLFDLYEAGVNRLSLGVQACQPRLLNVLGRIHSYDEAVEGVEMARHVGISNINLDLIFGIPGQSNKDWQHCLQEIIALEPEHLSLYGLQLEEGTSLCQSVERGVLKPCPEDDELEMYLYAQKFLETVGFEHYEISNFSRPGKYCRHNLRYWYNQEYLGAGPGAHSFFDKVRFANTGNIRTYANKLKAGQLPVESSETITPDLERAETVFLALRTLRGLDLKVFDNRFGIKAEDIYREQIEKLIGLGLVEVVDKHLRLTVKGLPLANAVFREFV